MRKNRNALLHGVHSREIILPGESRKQFKAHLNGTRLDFGPQGTTEDAIVFNMAHDLWRQRRVMALFQSAFVDSQGRCEVEKAEERRVEKGREKVNHTTEVVQFFEAAALLEKELKKTNMALGKLGANLRSLLSDFERLRPMILADAEAVDDDRAFKRLRSACELNARLDAQFAKKLQNLVLVREFKRQYRQDSNIKLLPHHPPTAHDAQVGAKASSKKTTDDDDWNDNDDNDNDNDNEIDPEDYDWEFEYDEALAEQKKARRRHRKRGTKGPDR